ERGRYGQKTGAGIYRYEPGSRKPIPDPEVRDMIRAEAERLGVEQREIGEAEIVERCIYGLVTEGARILEDGIAARASDIDVVWINGYGFPRHRGGPMFYADTVGARAVYEKVCEFRDRFGERYWSPPALLEELARTGGRCTWAARVARAQPRTPRQEAPPRADAHEHRSCPAPGRTAEPWPGGVPGGNKADRGHGGAARRGTHIRRDARAAPPCPHGSHSPGDTPRSRRSLGPDRNRA